MTRRQAAPLVALVAVSILLGILTTGITQFIAVMAAIALTLLWWTRVSSTTPTNRAERKRLPASVWVGIPLASMAAGIVTLPLLGYASIGIANAVLVATISMAGRQ